VVGGGRRARRRRRDRRIRRRRASGLWSAIVAIVLAAVFLGFTAGTILIANRWFGDPLRTDLLRRRHGRLAEVRRVPRRALPAARTAVAQPGVFFVALVASVVASLVIDAVVMTRMRIPAVSDVTCHPRGRRRRGASPDTAGGGCRERPPLRTITRGADRLSLRPFALRETRAQ
jgi:hypothetical protein